MTDYNLALFRFIGDELMQDYKLMEEMYSTVVLTKLKSRFPKVADKELMNIVKITHMEVKQAGGTLPWEI